MLSSYVATPARRGLAVRVPLLWLTLGVAVLHLAGCARPTLAEAERELNGDTEDAGNGHRGGSTTGPHNTTPSGHPHHDAGTAPAVDEDSGTPPSHDAGQGGEKPAQDAGDSTSTHQPGCPAQEPAIVSGHTCRTALTCQYGSTTCTCVLLGTWVCTH
jgi:hypothetical protein